MRTTDIEVTPAGWGRSPTTRARLNIVLQMWAEQRNSRVASGFCRIDNRLWFNGRRVEDDHAWFDADAPWTPPPLHVMAARVARGEAAWPGVGVDVGA